MSTRKYKVLTPLKTDSKQKTPHAVGVVVELDEADAAELVAIHALSPVADEAKKAK